MCNSVCVNSESRRLILLRVSARSTAGTVPRFRTIPHLRNSANSASDPSIVAFLRNPRNLLCSDASVHPLLKIMPSISPFPAFCPTLTHALDSPISSDCDASSMNPTAATGNRIEVSFNDLRPFEIVQSQYSIWGIRFENAIAFQPTNALFDIESIGVMPLSEPLKLMIAFQKLPQRVYLRFTAANRIHAALIYEEQPPVRQPLSECLSLSPQSSLPSAEAASSPIYSASESVCYPHCFPQYELDFIPSQQIPFQQIPSQPYQSAIADRPAALRVELQSTSPFVLQSMAIEVD